MNELEERLSAYAAGIDALMAMIPAKYYATMDEYSDQFESKYLRNKKGIKVAKTGIPATSTNNDINDKEIDERTSTTVLSPATLVIPPASATPALSITQLREKLQSRIDSLRKGRRAMPLHNTDISSTSDARSRDEILQLRQKRKQEQKAKKQRNKDSKIASITAAASGDIEIVHSLVASAGVKRKQSEDAPREVKEAVSFGILDFGEQSAAKKKKGPTDAAGRLQVLKAKNEKQKKFEAKNPDKAAAISETQQWNKMLAKASGEKIKDDEKLLEKTIKREGKVKAKKSREWAERKETVTKGIADRQKKRETNLKKRADSKKEGKSSNKKKKTKSK